MLATIVIIKYLLPFHECNTERSHHQRILDSDIDLNTLGLQVLHQHNKQQASFFNLCFRYTER